MDFRVFFNLLHFFESINPRTDDVTATTTTSTTFTTSKYKESEIVITENNLLKDCRRYLGCFPKGPPWEGHERPVALSPEFTNETNPFFCFHSPSKPKCQKIIPDETTKLGNLDVASQSYLVVLTHGFTHSSEVKWVTLLVKSLLENIKEVRVLVLDWNEGATPPYAQAVANTRLMGAITGRIIHRLVVEKGLSLSKTHLIGHSLGAHLFGYTGSYISNYAKIGQVGRITGLDPAGPYFKGTPKEVHLDETDAFLVDILHTDSTPIVPTLPVSLGLPELSGHLDFYPNGGGLQNGCTTTPKGHLLAQGGLKEAVLQFVSCSHERSITYIINSLSERCSYIGIECDSWKNFTEGRCWGCEEFRCFTMGVNLTQVLPSVHSQRAPVNDSEENAHDSHRLISRGEKHLQLFLKTASTKDSCGKQYRFSLLMEDPKNGSEPMSGEYAKLSVVVRGKHSTFTTNPSEKEIYMKPGEVYRWVDALPMGVGPIKSLVVTYVENESLLSPFTWRITSPTLRITEIVAESILGDEKTSFKFCDGKIKLGEMKILKTRCLRKVREKHRFKGLN